MQMEGLGNITMSAAALVILVEKALPYIFRNGRNSNEPLLEKQDQILEELKAFREEFRQDLLYRARQARVGGP